MTPVLPESDMVVAYLKKDDWLKPMAERPMGAVEAGKAGEVARSSATLHELYYVFSEHAPIRTVLSTDAVFEKVPGLRRQDPEGLRLP